MPTALIAACQTQTTDQQRNIQIRIKLQATKCKQANETWTNPSN